MRCWMRLAVVDAVGGGEIWVAQGETYGLQLGQFKLHLALDPATAGDDAGGGHASGQGGGLALERLAAGQQRALRNSVNFPISGVERHHHQRATQQAFGITDGRDCYIHARASAGEGWQ